VINKKISGSTQDSSDTDDKAHQVAQENHLLLMEDKILNNKHEFSKDSRLRMLKIIFALKGMVQKK
jgi:hypothetical protein